MNVRVTNQTQANSAIAYMTSRAADLAKFQDQVSSGLRVKLPSDDPAAYPALSQAKAATQRLSAYQQTIADSTSALDSGVSSLQDVNDALVRARSIALEGADAASAADPAARESLAVEVDGLIDRVLRVANSQPDGKSIFGGTAINSTPFRVATTDASGRPQTIAYDGASERTQTLTGPGQTVDTRYVGSDVFQQPGGDVFQSLIALRDNLRDTSLGGPAREQAFAQRLTDLDSARDSIASATGEQSSTLATLESLGKLTGDVKLLADERVGELAGTDYAEAVVKMQEMETALQAIYATTSQQFQSGLLDFVGR